MVSIIKNKARTARAILKKDKKVTLDLRRREAIPERKIYFQEGDIGTRSSLFA